MTVKAIAATSLFGAIAVAGAVGILMSGGATAPRRLVKKGGKAMDKMGKKMKSVTCNMGQS